MSTNLDWKSLEGLEPSGTSSNMEAASPQGNSWEGLEGLPSEPKGYRKAYKEVGRYALQPFVGAAEVTGPGIAASIWDLLGSGEALSALEEFDQNRMEELKQKFPSAPWENFKGIDKEKYMQSLQEARQTLPTVSNIASFLERTTGAPLEAHNRIQRLLRLGGGGAKLRPGSVKPKAIAGITAPVVSAGAEALGAPEPLADVIGLAASQIVPEVGAEYITKESGLPTRWYESISKERDLSPRQYRLVKDAVEKDVRTITDQLITSRNKTASAIKTSPDFLAQLEDGFDQVANLAKNIKTPINPQILKNNYRKMFSRRPSKGFIKGDYDKAYRKEFKNLFDQIPIDQPLSFTDALETFRETNKTLRQMWKPGESKAVNRGKLDAYIDLNRAISDTFKDVEPTSNFNKLFKETNKAYSDVQKLDTINSYFDDIFSGEKLNFRKARQIYNDPEVKEAFNGLIGKEGYDQMKDVMTDFISTEKANSLLKKAEAVGFKNMGRYVKRWIFSPVWAKFSAVKDVMKYSANETLASQRFRLTWKSAMNNFKSGNFAKAEQDFKSLEAMSKT